MDSLFRKHDRMLANTSMEIIRDKMDEIHWNARLVSIMGAKGVGKSTLIRQYLKQHFGPGDRRALYCSADTVEFSTRTLLGCVVNVCQIRVNENDVFVNPFSRNAKPYRVKHNNWYSYVCLYVPSRDLEIELAMKLVKQSGGQISFSEFILINHPYHLNRLKTVLAEKDFTNEWLAEQLGFKPVTVSNWCNNTIQPPILALLKIKMLLEVDIKDLIRFDELDKHEI